MLARVFATAARISQGSSMFGAIERGNLRPIAGFMFFAAFQGFFGRSKTWLTETNFLFIDHLSHIL